MCPTSEISYPQDYKGILYIFFEDCFISIFTFKSKNLPRIDFCVWYRVKEKLPPEIVYETDNQNQLCISVAACSFYLFHV